MAGGCRSESQRLAHMEHMLSRAHQYGGFDGSARPLHSEGCGPTRLLAQRWLRVALASCSAVDQPWWSRRSRTSGSASAHAATAAGGALARVLRGSLSLRGRVERRRRPVESRRLDVGVGGKLEASGRELQCWWIRAAPARRAATEGVVATPSEGVPLFVGVAGAKTAPTPREHRRNPAARRSSPRPNATRTRHASLDEYTGAPQAEGRRAGWRSATPPTRWSRPMRRRGRLPPRGARAPRARRRLRRAPPAARCGFCAASGCDRPAGRYCRPRRAGAAARASAGLRRHRRNEEDAAEGGRRASPVGEKVAYLQAGSGRREAPKTPAPSLEIGTDDGRSRSERWKRVDVRLTF